MRPRNTLILLLVAALLGAVVWWSNRHEVEKKEAEEQSKRLFSGIEPEQVEWIALRTTEGRDAKLARVEGAWRVVEPIDFPADATNADAMASALAQMTAESTLEEAQAPEVYGLGDAARVVRFRVAGADRELRIGKKTPIGANSYVSVAGDEPEVRTVATFRTTAFERALDDLRERRPLRFAREGIERIEASWPDGGVVLEKRDGAWRLVQPIEAPADAEAVETLLSDLTFLRASGFRDDPPPDAEVGLDAPVYRVVLTGKPVKEGDPAPRHELAIGDTVDTNERAGRAAEPALYEIPQDRVDKLPKTLVAFRDKTLARFDSTEARRFELVFPESGGATSSVVTIAGERAGDEGWTTSPEPMGAGQAARLVSELSRLAGDDIAAEEMGERELAGVGLAPPGVEVKVYGAKPEDEGAAAPLLAHVLLGSAKDGRVLAKTPSKPQVFELDPVIGEHVPLGVEPFRERFVAKEPPPPAEGEVPAAGEAAPPDGGFAPVPGAPPAAPPTGTPPALREDPTGDPARDEAPDAEP